MRSSCLFLRALGVALLSLGTIVASAQSATSAPASLDALLEGFQSVTGLHARFREEKHIALLAAPLTSEGEIFFARPGGLLRRVTEPTPSEALIANGRLSLRSGSERQDIDLTQNPVLSAFVQSFQHVLVGDRAALERAYEVQYSHDGAAWSLRLRPRNRQLREFLQEMTLSGNGTSMQEMVMLEASGDRTTTRFFDVDLNRSFSASERRSLFGG